MKKFWQIAGTNEFSDDKLALKKTRTALNAAAGIIESLKVGDEKYISPAKWPFRITKGPEHPKVLPYFKEVRIGTLFVIGGNKLCKTSPTEVGVLGDDWKFSTAQRGIVSQELQVNVL